jgi:hypothetical protein
MAEEISFAGFGPIPSSNPTFAGGFGRSGSFVPIDKNPIDLYGIAKPINQQQLFPFAVLRQYQGSTLNYGVYYYSDLMGSVLDSTSGISITGLLQDNPTESDPSWFTCNAGDSIYLEIAFSSGSPSTAKIKHGTNYVGGIWVTGGDLEDDGGSPPYQTYARKLIAKINTDLTVDQKLNSNIGMTYFCANGIPASYPISI